MAVVGRKRRVIMVGGEGVVLFAPSGNGIVRETSFSWEVPNFQQRLAEILGEQNQSKSVAILFDGADQTYRREDNIPKLSPIDRPRFVKRKLELAFPAYNVRGALEIKPPKIKGVPPGSPSYLFVAVPEIDNLERVGGAVFDAGVPVSGFGLLPTESAALVSELSEKVFSGNERKSRWAVLVGQHETGGLRQIVVKDGNLALTRLTPPSEAGTSGAAWAESVIREFRATMNYVGRFGFNPADGLDVMFICGNVEKQFFDEQALGVQNFRCLTVSEALKQIGVNSIAFDKSNFADALHAAWVSRKSKLVFPMSLPSIQKITGPRQIVQYASWALGVSAIAMVGLSGQSYYGYQTLQSEIEAKESQRNVLEREYNQEAKVFDSLPVKPAIVNATLAVKTVTEKNSPQFSKIAHKLKASLGEDILLETLVFKHVPDVALNLGGTAAAKPAQAAAPARGKGQPVPPQQPVVQLPTDQGTVTVAFKFTLPGKLTLEQKVMRSEALLATLQKDFPGYTVTLVSQFGNVTRGGKYSGDVAGSTVPPAAGKPADTVYAEFKLEGPSL